MRRFLSIGSFVAAFTILALLSFSFSFSGAVFAQGGTATPAGTATEETEEAEATATTATGGAQATATTATGGAQATATPATGAQATATPATGAQATATPATGAQATATAGTGTVGSTTGGTPGQLPSTAEGNSGPLAPPIVFVLLLALMAGAIGFFALAARRNAER